MTVQVSNFINLLNGIASHSGISVNTILDELSLTTRDIENPSAHIKWEITYKLLALATKLSGDNFIGLKIGLNASHMMMGEELGVLISLCPDFRIAGMKFCEYSSIIGEMVVFSFFEDNEECTIQFKGLLEWKEIDITSYITGVEINAAGIYTITKYLSQNKIFPKRIEFEFPRNRDREIEYRKAFGENTHFQYDTRASAVVFKKSELSQSNPYFSERAYNEYLLKTQDRMAETNQTINLSSRVRNYLQNNYYNKKANEISVEDIAVHLSMSVRELQRELEGRSFIHIKDEVRKSLVNKYILYKSNKELSKFLKFGALTTYNKWFKKQFGCTPKEYKKLKSNH